MKDDTLSLCKENYFTWFASIVLVGGEVGGNGVTVMVMTAMVLAFSLALVLAVAVMMVAVATAAVVQ